MTEILRMKSLDERNYYELLEVPEDAPKVAVQEAFFSSRSLFDQESAVSYNFFSDQEREGLLHRLQQAYETLMDDQKRMEYDRKIFNRVGKWYSPPVERPIPVVHDPSAKREHRSTLPLEAFAGEDGRISLKRLREAHGVSLEEVSRVTRIRGAMIIALENRDIRKLPPEIYVKGYLKSYAETLGIDPQRLIEAYGPLSLRPS